jgi:hypothetical protein
MTSSDERTVATFEVGNFYGLDLFVYVVEFQ